MLDQVPWSNGFERQNALMDEIDREVAEVTGVGVEGVSREAALDPEIGEKGRGGGFKGFGDRDGTHQNGRIGAPGSSRAIALFLRDLLVT